MKKFILIILIIYSSYSINKSTSEYTSIIPLGVCWQNYSNNTWAFFTYNNQNLKSSYLPFSPKNNTFLVNNSFQPYIEPPVKFSQGYESGFTWFSVNLLPNYLTLSWSLNGSTTDILTSNLNQKCTSNTTTVTIQCSGVVQSNALTNLTNYLSTLLNVTVQVDLINKYTGFEIEITINQNDQEASTLITAMLFVENFRNNISIANDISFYSGCSVLNISINSLKTIQPQPPPIINTGLNGGTITGIVFSIFIGMTSITLITLALYLTCRKEPLLPDYIPVDVDNNDNDQKMEEIISTKNK